MTMHNVPSEAFDTGLLNKEFHERLLGDLDQVVHTAGVPPHAVWTRLSDYCAGEEFSWIRNMRSTQESGLVYVGESFDPEVYDRMVAITGAFLRNYINARVMPLQDVLKALKNNTMPEPTILLIPNFCTRKDDGGDVPTWDTAPLMSMLISRMTKGLKTIVYCSSMAVLEKQYGASFRKHFESRYSQCTTNDFAYSVKTTAKAVSA